MNLAAPPSPGRSILGREVTSPLILLLRSQQGRPPLSCWPKQQPVTPDKTSPAGESLAARRRVKEWNMSNFTAKQLHLVDRLRPTFSLNEIPAAHAILDWCGAPRRLKGQQLTLPDRILYLNNLLAEARAKSSKKQIFILSKSESEALIPEEYRKLEVKP